jgi:hypothetical protein
VTTNNIPSQASARSAVENAREIKITKRTIRFGSSVYQFKNITGFKVGKVPGWKFPRQTVWTLMWIGGLAIGIAIAIAAFANKGSFNFYSSNLYVTLLAEVTFVLGICLILIDLVILIAWLCQKRPLAFILYLNSGHEWMFMSYDRNFLMKIVATLYDFMESDDSSLFIDMSNRSVTVGRDFHGKAVTGDKNTMS